VSLKNLYLVGFINKKQEFLSGFRKYVIPPAPHTRAARARARTQTHTHERVDRLKEVTALTTQLLLLNHVCWVSVTMQLAAASTVARPAYQIILLLVRIDTPFGKCFHTNIAHLHVVINIKIAHVVHTLCAKQALQCLDTVVCQHGRVHWWRKGTVVCKHGRVHPW
jgi:hypothetical protein